ncbi:hypothetical protein ACQKQA_23360 [Pseudomonas sp. NPDC089530]|uniref:hypothetical protein n=1 Tax=Pseudomonas sp. NPDC089530 TaxID=3390651 RepID=UPI003CFFA670
MLSLLEKIEMPGGTNRPVGAEVVIKVRAISVFSYMFRGSKNFMKYLLTGDRPKVRKKLRTFG